VKGLFTIVTFGLATAALADGPGSRIRASPDFPQPREAIENSAKRCDALREEEKERCLKDLRAAEAANEKRRGPEATGAGSGAGSGASSGTSGGGTFGGSAPR
jgi:hypothetical protein